MSGKMVERDVADFFPAQRRTLFQDCLVCASEAVLDRISLQAPPTPGLRKGCRIVVTQPDFLGRLSISLGPGQTNIRIEGRGPINLDVRTWRHSRLTIAEGTTINQARIICDDADIAVGKDGLWSDEILVQSNDQHGIIDLNTMKVCNAARRRIMIHDHVWVGRRSILMPDVEVGKGAILAAGAILTSDMPENTIFAGVPARLIRENVSWSRAPVGFSTAERRLMGVLPGDG